MNQRQNYELMNRRIYTLIKLKRFPEALELAK